MRLIDADKYCDFLNRYPLEKAQNNFMLFYREALQETFECEVEAIPIEWITKWAEKFYTVINGKRYYMGDGYDTTWDLLEDWERENQYGKN